VLSWNQPQEYTPMRHIRTSTFASARSPAPTGAGGGLLSARDLAAAWFLIGLIAVPAWR
jgi:hypothetical protein